ncbi:MAG: STAS domain-containing protein [Betaproteobacteria bacterium]
MDIATAARDNVSIVRVNGYLDTAASGDFERKMIELLQAGSRLFAIDFTRVEMVTSAGIRILMMVAKRIGGTERVVVWGLNEQVKVVFTIAGLAKLFPIVDSEQAAFSRLSTVAASATPAAAEVSKMARLTSRLLGDSKSAPAGGAAGADRESKMAAQVAQLLSGRRAGPGNR